MAPLTLRQTLCMIRLGGGIPDGAITPVRTVQPCLLSDIQKSKRQKGKPAPLSPLSKKRIKSWASPNSARNFCITSLCYRISLKSHFFLTGGDIGCPLGLFYREPCTHLRDEPIHFWVKYSIKIFSVFVLDNCP